MALTTIEQDQQCYHCGYLCESNSIRFDDKDFCCQGCKAVYEIINSSNLSGYYQLECTPGIRQDLSTPKFAYLDSPEIAEKLLNFSSEDLSKVNFSIPAIHCSSCIWLLENLPRMHQGILYTQVNLGRRDLTVDFDPRAISLGQLVTLLANVGYQPLINLEKAGADKDPKTGRSLILKIAVAGFCFGNIMLLSFPEYLGLEVSMDTRLANWFAWIILVLSLPVLFFCATDYFASAFKWIKQRHLNIDVPIVLGILALAGQSYYEILSDSGQGYLDSLAGLLFLLLVGRWFQGRTYSNLSFDRDFKSYFPLAVTKIIEGYEKSVLVEELQAGDQVVIRNGELIPADCILLDPVSEIDYSFVSGESEIIVKKKNDHIFAGGRQVGLMAHYQVVKPVSQSYLTQLWNHQAFKHTKNTSKPLIDGISRYFTLTILIIALIAGTYWWFADPSRMVFVVTSVLIVACPCALAMATPFTQGNVLRVMGKNKLYLKNTGVIDEMSAVNTLVFDKTGTLTGSTTGLTFSHTLDRYQAWLLHALTAQSNHPASADIRKFLRTNYNLPNKPYEISDYQELAGQGVSALINGNRLKLGSAKFMGLEEGTKNRGTYYSINQKMIGTFHRSSNFREALSFLFKSLSGRFKLAVLSGDSSDDAATLSRLLPSVDIMLFNQQPIDKLRHIEHLQAEGGQVMMLGDGLNDAGALKQSEVGLAVTEDPHQFTPASDGILHASALGKLYHFICLSKWSKRIVVMGFILSFLYNIVGISFAVSGNLTPLTAAILMPLSSISVVLFATGMVDLVAGKLNLK